MSFPIPCLDQEVDDLLESLDVTIRASLPGPRKAPVVTTRASERTRVAPVTGRSIPPTAVSIPPSADSSERLEVPPVARSTARATSERTGSGRWFASLCLVLGCLSGIGAGHVARTRGVASPRAIDPSIAWGSAALTTEAASPSLAPSTGLGATRSEESGPAKTEESKASPVAPREQVARATTPTKVSPAQKAALRRGMLRAMRSL